MTKMFLQNIYEFKELIGWGSFGVVVLVIHKQSKKYIALKILHLKGKPEKC
jgi:serine/threonine protein kinase